MNRPGDTSLGKTTIDRAAAAASTYDTRLDDCVLSCNDDKRLPANTYAMVTSCTVLAMFFEEMPVDERVFYVDVPSDRVQPVIDLVHGKMHIGQLCDVPAITDILDVMDYLGCTTKWRKLVHRLWTLLRNEPPDRAGPVLMQHAQLLLPEFGIGYIHKLRLVYPNWQDFQRIFDHIVVTARLANVLLEALSRFFPVGLLVATICRHAPVTHRTDIAQQLLSFHRLGTMLHPEETTWMITHLPFIPVLDCVRDAFSEVNRPIGSKLPASMITYPHKHMASFYIVTEGLTRRTTLQFASNTASFSFDPDNGNGVTSTVNVDMNKLGDTASISTTVYVRSTTYTTEGDAHDTWHDIDLDHDATWTITNDVPLGVWTKIDVFWLHDPRIC